jgi:multicomponent Na+:H+ antiporter subunit E
MVPLRVETDLGVTTIANSITLTPGTLTLDYDPERNALYVHVIDGGKIDGVVGPIRTWEDHALRVFDERASPDDVADPVAVYPADEPSPPTVEATTAPEGDRGGHAERDRRDDAARNGDRGGERDGR